MNTLFHSFLSTLRYLLSPDPDIHLLELSYLDDPQAPWTKIRPKRIQSCQTSPSSKLETAIYPVAPAAIPDFLFYKQLPVISPLSPTS